ncbi:MBL fold metallo-hydrolase [Ammoniphilus sp. CFH 90114]|uniref:MBL fold metallo-hydrolase n=1 Tax=Ammoniphilus sp. CFH 90114 TaxID=2493665 RepID=UPI00100F708F|nr:MBL fold metallo-hydrolase [Ammoniphilus sp. CFH 90114]RXT06548.1 MBL fold metallo-hydrolase [Ammoniphilus sp. CFH 90114]
MEKYGLYQITIPLPFRLNHVHCYLARQGNRWKIIDTGLNRKETENVWQEAFETNGINVAEDIDDIILTHHHPDHLGFAGRMEEWTQAPVKISKLAGYWAQYVWQDSTYSKTREFFENNGLPADLLVDMAEYDQKFHSYLMPLPKRLETFEEGEYLQIGELKYEAISTPGHADGHMCFYNLEEKVLLGGDHILKKITPNISYYGYGEENPLKAYIESLNRIQSLEISLILPGHGPIITDVGERINEILKHHEERLAQVLDDVIGEETAYDICNRLFKRELTVHEQRFAMGETLAHLNYLVGLGEIQKSVDDGGNVLFKK